MPLHPSDLADEAKRLVAQMTLKEKAGFCSGADFWHLKSLERLGLRQIMVSDGPHGLRKQAETSDHLGMGVSVPATCFPAAGTLASAWDPELCQQMGEALAKECAAEDVAVILGPGINIKRNPLCGRNFEYFSEDPLLAGVLAAAFIRGVQSQGVGCSLKHFAANNQETFRMVVDTRVDERTLRERIDSMLYERTALSQKPDETIAQELARMRDAQRMSPALVMRDPYILDFLGLRDTWQEGDLEAAIIREMESFLLELGAGFSFVARQKRIQIDDDDFHLDLLFYNRKLRRLVAVELKIGDFKAAYKGQMELYLRWLDKYEREPEEASPLGIILCTGKKREQIELLELDKSGIHVAEYLTSLPPRAVLVERLQQATHRAQLRIEQRRKDKE